jgi:hypothetical protein
MLRWPTLRTTGRQSVVAVREECGSQAEPSATYLYGWVRAFFHPLPAAVGPFAKWTRSDCGDKDRWATTR